MIAPMSTKLKKCPDPAVITSLINAHVKASGIERLMTGSYIDPLERNINLNGNSLIPIRSDDGSKIVHNINIFTINGNVKKVFR